MGSPLGWEKYVGEKGIILGIDTFGISGKGNQLIEGYGFTVENVVNKVEELLKKRG
jgi:transketolase